MDLWIRSQDKEDLVKVDNIRIKHEYYQKEAKDNYGRISAYIDGNYMKSIIYVNSSWLGEYKTKERALEVLDEIQHLLRGHVYESHINKFDIYNGDDIKVYEMPEE